MASEEKEVNALDPLPVLIAEGQEPVPVTMVAAPGGGAPMSAQQIQSSPVMVTAGQGTVAAPTETESDLQVTAGQRRINLVWEMTQALIAFVITAAVVYVSIFQIDSPDLGNAFFVIIGFYYGRVNHAARGGVGRQPATQVYEGR